MKMFGAIVLILTSFNLVGQNELKRIVLLYPESNDVKEIYYVLKSNNKIKQGDYYAFYKGQLTKKELKNKSTEDYESFGLKEKGYFENDLKNGVWVFYKEPKVDKNGTSFNVISEQGKYLKNQKVGIWDTHFENGKVIKHFDFDSNKELAPKIKLNIRYPSDAKENGIEGTVIIKIIFDNCEPINYEIIKDIGYGCADSVIRGLKEKRELEKNYGVESSNCKVREDFFKFSFKLN